jgi:hypothetical protein
LFPEIVPLNSEGQPMSVNYDRLTVLLISEIKKLQDRIVLLEQK